MRRTWRGIEPCSNDMQEDPVRLGGTGFFPRNAGRIAFHFCRVVFLPGNPFRVLGRDKGFYMFDKDLLGLIVIQAVIRSRSREE